jgi:UDP-N-acetyl-D-glucosamine dehydrogenase
VVLESTTYPRPARRGAQTDTREWLWSHRGTDFHLGYSPERIDAGKRTGNLYNTPKVIGGIDEQSGAAVDRLQFINRREKGHP